jgi:hypothetical protein
MVATPRKTAGPIRALFIGNSFTARNNLPGLVSDLAAGRGIELEPRLLSMGGASLRMHWNKGQAQKEIETRRYDWVVLQEQSTLPVKNAARMHESVRLFDGAIRSAGAKTALYLTWARLNAPQSQRAITDAYTSIGREIGATMVPVGVAWERVLAALDAPVLHDKDGSHPSPAGSYLAACVFLAALFDEAPVGTGAAPEGLSATQVKLLQRAARDAVKS